LLQLKIKKRAETCTPFDVMSVRKQKSVAVQLLFHFTALLCFQRQGCCRTGKQARNTDGFTGFFTPAVVSFVYAHDGLLNFFQQFAFAVTGAQFQRMLFFDGGAVSRIRNQNGFAKMFGSFVGVLQQVLFQLLQACFEKASCAAFM
jgi:hypothetical protein